jgi:C4-type Zn-finger protein
MEWLLLVALLLLVVGFILLFPGLTAPHCPMCSARLQPQARAHSLIQWRDWEICWRNFLCPECLFRHDYLRIGRKSKDAEYETRTIH